MKKQQSGYAYVRVKDEPHPVLVPISSQKPEIPEKIVSKWQNITNLTAEILGVPSGLITKLTPENLEIFVASHTEGNPYKKKDSDKLGIGMFCETVAGKNEKLTVQDVNDNAFWEHNPHAGLGMKSYSGVPLCWEDGEIFGTFCMLTDETNRFSQKYNNLILQFSEVIEDDLRSVLFTEELKDQLGRKELQIREAHHRIKNHFNMLIAFLQIQCQNTIVDPQHLIIEVENRIHALSVIHEKLYMTEQKDELPLDAYIQDLTEIILKNLSVDTVTTRFAIDPISIPQEKCVSIGLILSELISNSIKYAFQDNPEPGIQIMMTASDKGQMLFRYKDNGSGYPEDDNDQSDSSLGLCLIRMLCNQLGSIPVISNRNGADFRLELEMARLYS